MKHYHMPIHSNFFIHNFLIDARFQWCSPYWVESHDTVGWQLSSHPRFGRDEQEIHIFQMNLLHILCIFFSLCERCSSMFFPIFESFHFKVTSHIFTYMRTILEQIEHNYCSSPFSSLSFNIFQHLIMVCWTSPFPATTPV